MAISKEAYQALKDIVGPMNISSDEAVVDTYAFQYLAETVRPDQSPFMPRPAAVIVPGSTEEIQAIVKACNRYRIKVKPYSTGWYFLCAPLKDGQDTIQLDLRRMDHILEIDEKNMFAVIEPYVICATLQTELMKLGLNVNVSGAGACSSLLASATSYIAIGESNISLGNNSENLLGLEWVTPRGDILRTGSLGSGAGWFCGEGPGPSLRGICRGTRGALGAMGIYTKCALKLSHWPGPPDLPITGTVPAYRSPIPDKLKVYCLGFPSWSNYADAHYKVYDNEIGYIFARMLTYMGEDLGPAFWLLHMDPNKKLNDIVEMVKRPEVRKLAEEMKHSCQIILAGRSLRDIEYQDKVLDQILADTGGWKIAKMAEPELAEFIFLCLHRASHRGTLFSYVGGFYGPFSQKGPPDNAVKIQPVIREWGRQAQKEGCLVQCGGNSTVGNGSLLGGGGITGFEEMAYYDPADKESIRGLVKHAHKASQDAIKNGFPPGKESAYFRTQMTDEQLNQEYANASQTLPYQLQGKIKKLLDPQDLGDRLYEYLQE
jgi:hypothetical protein